jgi:hypothetical protein
MHRCNAWEETAAPPSTGYMELAGSWETMVVIVEVRVVTCQRMTCSFQLRSTEEARMFWPVLVAGDQQRNNEARSCSDCCCGKASVIHIVSL